MLLLEEALEKLLASIAPIAEGGAPFRGEGSESNFGARCFR